MRFWGCNLQKLAPFWVVLFLAVWGISGLSASALELSQAELSTKVKGKRVVCKLSGANRVLIGFYNRREVWQRFPQKTLNELPTKRKSTITRTCRNSLAALRPTPIPTSPAPNEPPTSPTPTTTSTPAPTAIPTYANENSPLGTNLSGNYYYVSEWPFVDIFKTSSPWVSISGYTADPRPLDLDEFGYVRSLRPAENGLQNQFAQSYLLRNTQGNYPSGQYIVLYEGQGVLSYLMGAQKNTALSRPGRDVVEVNGSSGGIAVRITSVNPNDYIRNIRMIMPGGVCSDDKFKYCRADNECAGQCDSFEQNYETQIFHPIFLDRIKHSKVLRFMDLMQTNHSTQGAWEDRPKVADATWASDKGVPLEILIELANRLHADAWFCMPHLADDDYVRNFAGMANSGLEGGLKAYIEYSNEVWNNSFAQYHYARQQGIALNLAADGNLASLRFYSQRAVEIFSIWEDVFGGSERLQRILASQAGNAWTGNQIMNWQNAFEKAEALAIAPYFGGSLGQPGTQNTIAALSLNELFDNLENIQLPQAISNMEANAANAQAKGIKLIAYEGGQHLVGVGGAENNQALTDLFIAANRDPRMGDLYRVYLSAWRQAGGDMFANFTSTYAPNKWGSWGVLEYQDQPISAAPKYQALMDYLAQNQSAN